MKNLIMRFWAQLLFFFKKADYGTITVPYQPDSDDILSKIIYVVEKGEKAKWVLMRCPCGCKAILTLSLMKTITPYWQIEVDNLNRVSLSPSVWRMDGCRSHFFLRNGKISWCKT